MDISAATASLGLTQAAVSDTIALSLLKQNAKVGQQIANLVEQGAQNAAAAASSGRGKHVNITV